ncbi:hypothetical protein MACJ_003792 [Theileria orientalis]|uniref:Uncharacterized protein n=1 Tax=Theileria orientalis TaxID=68886 RepID=A0A976SKI7_THEOR|nr:hypothetical protein MACJ_003792 [Theileria orientalis]
MDDRCFTRVFENKGYSYRTEIKFMKPDHDDSIQNCTLGNADFLEESSVIDGLVELTGIERLKIGSLLSGDIHISDIPELDYTNVLEQKTRLVSDGCYFFSLQNGVVVFGLDRSHEIMKFISKGSPEDDMKVVYSDKLLSNIYTESRAKRRRNRRFNLSHICSITMTDTTYKVKLPEELSNLEVIETNTRLTSEPELLSTEEGWLLILLDKDKTLFHRKLSRSIKANTKCS